jgi:hypothetical protein
VKRIAATAWRWPDALVLGLAGGLFLFLGLLPFHLVIKRLVPGPIGTYWKEGLLAILIVLWAALCWRERRLQLTGTPLDMAAGAYLGLLVLRFFIDGAGWVPAWGLYMSVLYFPLFWIVPAALRGRPTLQKALLALLVGLGAALALGGLLEFVLDVALWPSVELVQRQGFADVSIYGTQTRRVYFTLDSPTTLANTLALLLPLALGLLATARRLWARVAAGLAALLMAGCIVVTFSRGIWVASAATLLVMGALSRPSLQTSLPRGARRGWLAALGGLLLLVAGVWGLTRIASSGENAGSEAGVMELPPSAFQTAPVKPTGPALLDLHPGRGLPLAQVWTLSDPITSEADTRRVLYHHPPASGRDELAYTVEVPENGALQFAIALAPETWSPNRGDGASFQIFVTGTEGSKRQEFVFTRYINPKHNPSDRRWRNYLVDLSPWAGQTVHMSLITEAGPAGDWAFDWAGWAEPQVVEVEPGFYDTATSDNPIVRHVRSIADWVRDETNRDRLAAWSQGLAAWRAAPLWGQGLGTTGAAALRTQPGQALITESQVLKALVELGPLGLLVWGFLWLQIARVALQVYRATLDIRARTAVRGRTAVRARTAVRGRLMLLAILASLLVAFVEGWVYQNLEAKQVNAIFWTLVGLLALSTRPDGAALDRYGESHLRSPEEQAEE